jgi:pimeloyl-ACP methyl ester carboxylesterase
MRIIPLLALLCLALLACGSSSSGQASADAGPDATFSGSPPGPASSCPVVVSQSNCDTTQLPILFVHGTYSSGTEMSHMAQLLGSNGFCQDRITAIDYDSVALTASLSTGGVDSPGVDCTSPNNPPGCGMIDQAVEALKAKFNVTQVNLAGHSQGTFHCGDYLALHSDKIAHYINFSGVPDVGGVPTLSLSSLRDLDIPGAPPPHHATGTSNCAFQLQADGGLAPVAPDGGIDPDGGAEPVALSPYDPDAGVPEGGAPCNVVQVTEIVQEHFAVCSSKESFIQVYRFLTGKEPMYTDVQCGDDPVTVEGVSETFADNSPITMGSLEITEVGSTPSADAGTTMTVMADSNGHFGPVQIKRGVQYAFSGFDQNGNRVGGWQFPTPFLRDNRLMRLLSPPTSADTSPVASLINSEVFNHLVKSPNDTILVARWGEGGFRQDLGASLQVNGTEVLTSDNSGIDAGMTQDLQGGVAALFMEDANQNGKTDLGVPYMTTFIAFTDVFVNASQPSFVNLTFTAGSEDTSTVTVPLTAVNYPSTQGLVEVVFQ